MNLKVDDYIQKSAPFALPILEHLRALVHKVCIDVDEQIKWGMPFFLLQRKNDVSYCCI